MSFGEKLENFEPYEPFKYNGQIRLDANESCYSLPDSIKDEMLKELLNIELNRYPDPYAVDLCTSFAEFYGLDPSNVVAGNGSDELISIILGSVLPRGSKVLVTAPDFSMYNFYCGVTELECFVYGKAESDFSFDPSDVVDYINRKKIDFFIFSNPCNPTGYKLSVKEVEFLLENSGCMVCVDEAYMDFTDGSILPLVSRYDNLIVLKTLSKNIGLAGLRVGFAVSAEKNIKFIKIAKSPYNVNVFSQKAAEVVLKNKDYLHELTERLTAGRKKLSKNLKRFENDGFKVFDSETNFVYIKTSGAQNIYKKLLEKDIVIRCFGSEYLRISAGTEKENDMLLNCLDEILRS